MRSATVHRNGELVGRLTEEDGGHYVFCYDEIWFADTAKPAVSLTMPKSQMQYENDTLFPFFFNLLSEGANRKLQSLVLKIDENDHFGYLLATARADTIGAITVMPTTDAS